VEHGAHDAGLDIVDHDPARDAAEPLEGAYKERDGGLDAMVEAGRALLGGARAVCVDEELGLGRLLSYLSSGALGHRHVATTLV